MYLFGFNNFVSNFSVFLYIVSTRFVKFRKFDQVTCEQIVILKYFIRFILVRRRINRINITFEEKMISLYSFFSPSEFLIYLSTKPSTSFTELHIVTFSALSTMIIATLTSQSIESSKDFLRSPLFLLQKVTYNIIIFNLLVSFFLLLFSQFGFSFCPSNFIYFYLILI